MYTKQKLIFETIAAHIPQLIVEQHIADPGLTGVRVQFLIGTLMFADISGFTAMSEKLSEQGKEGAEELSGILNNCFNRMLNITVSYQGILLNFGGDAMLLLFKGHQHAARAVRCALKMQQMMKRFHRLSTSQGPFQLEMSIGINSGEFFKATVGAPEEQFLCLLTGKETNRTAEVEALASAGEIFISSGTISELEGRIETGDEREGYFEVKNLRARARRITPVSLYPEEKDLEKVTDTLASYLPKQIAKWIKAKPEKAGLEGEHRRVTMMFINLLGSSELVEESGQDRKEEIAGILNTYFLKLQETVKKYEGMILGCDLSTKGDKIFIIFGAPVAHEDDEERAVRCALEMKQQLAESGLPFRQRIGINTGYVYCGEVGSTLRKEYTVIGDQVNLAARLMAIAREEQILVGPSTYSKVSGKFVFQTNNPVRLKGKSEPVTAYQLKGIKAERALHRKWSAGELIGRGKEVAIVKEITEHARSGRGQMLGITGEAGIGKSRLVQELTLLWANSGGSIHTGNCQSYGTRIPYLPWIDLLNSFFNLQAGDTDTMRIEKIEAVISDLRPNLREWTALMGNLLGITVKESDVLKSLDPKLRHQRLMDIILELLQAQSEKTPMLLIFEDMHWSDTASGELLSYIGSNIKGNKILLCLAYRPLKQSRAGFKEPGNYTEIVLGKLSPESSRELARSIMKQAELPEEINQLLAAKSQGNPLFVKEVISSLMAAGYLELNDSTGEYQLSGQFHSAEVPDTVQGLIMAHLDQMEKETANVLRIASVIGQVFQYDVLKNIYPRLITDRELQQRLDDLENSGLACLQADEPVPEYQFNHALTQDVAYDTLLFARRRELHHKIGEYFEKQHAGHIDSYYELLAYHFGRTTNKGKTLEYSVRAGNKVKEMFANKEAIRYYQKALELAAEFPENRAGGLGSKIQEALGDIYELTGQFDKALDSYRYCQQCSEDLAAKRGRRRSKETLSECYFPGLPSPCDLGRYLPIIQGKIGLVYERKGQYETALESLDEGINRIIDDGVEKARLLISRAGVVYRQGKYTQALEWCHKGLDIARDANAFEEQAHVYYLMGTIHSELGNIEQAIDLRLDSLDLYQKCSDLPGQARAHNNLAIDYYFQGNWEKAREHYRKSIEIKKKTGDIKGLSTTANNLGELLSDQGHLEEAIESFEECLKNFTKIGYTLGVALSYSNLGKAHVRQGDYRQGLVLLQKGLDIFEQLQSGFLTETYQRLGEAYLGLNQSRTALEYCAQSLTMAQEKKMTVVEGVTRRVMGQAHRLLGEWNKAEELLVESERMLQELGVPYELGQTRWQLGLLYHGMDKVGYQLDRESRAKQLLKKAMITFNQLGVKFDPGKMADWELVMKSGQTDQAPEDK